MFRPATSVIVLALAVLAACSSGPVVPPVADATRAAEARAAIERGDYPVAREHYTELVRRTTGDERSRYQLELARTELASGNADATLAVLSGIAPPLPEGLDADIAAVRAEAFFLQGNAVEAVRLLVEREIWLDSADAILDNQNRIWAGLSQALNRSAGGFRTGDSIIDGWLALAPLTALTNNEQDFRSALLDWRSEFPDHPATGGILSEQLALIRAPLTQAYRIALLLPLSNPELRVQALAVRDGVFGGHWSHTGNGRVEIRVYDTAPLGSVQSYEDAQLEGADFIIGPLLSDDVRDVQQAAGFVPTLALNVSSLEMPAASNFYQFSLSFDDEIEAIATRAIAAGHETAVILHPSDPSGRRRGTNFRTAFEARGGRVIDSAAYVSTGQDFANQIESVFNINRSEQRRDRIARDLGRTNIEFEPRRRADVDMIFLPASAQDGRLLVPLLRRSNAGDIPTYSTREIYDQRRSTGDPDLDGVIFTDVPLLIDPTGEARTAAELLSAFSSDAASFDRRLYAFGFDAYLLADALYSGGASSWPLAGATGELYLGDNGRIRRRLPFAEFSNGRPRSTGPAIGLLGSR